MSGLIKPLDMNYVSKPWGWELWICNSEKYCGKKLFIKQGHWLSYHHHEIKDEVLFVESGCMWMTYGSDEKNFVSIKMEPGFAFHVEPGLRHQMQAIQDTLILEFSTQHFDSDSYRTTRDLVANHDDREDFK
jgi:mannose-6-phosphate isomerase-like protein (cupin superfamily)